MLFGEIQAPSMLIINYKNVIAKPLSCEACSQAFLKAIDTIYGRGSVISRSFWMIFKCS